MPGTITGDNNQVTINITDSIPPDNMATIDKNGMVGNTYTKTQFDQSFSNKSNEIDTKIENIKQLVETDFQGTLKPSDAAPTADGLYKPEISSEEDKPTDPNSTADWGKVYPNAGSLRAKSGYDTLFYKKGSVWKKSESKMPAAQSKIDTWTAVNYPIGKQVFYEGKIYESTDGVLANEIPGVSSKWKELITVLQSFLNPIFGAPMPSFGKVGQNVIAQINGLDWLYTKESTGWKKIYQLTQIGGGVYKSKNGLIISETFETTNNWNIPATYSATQSPTFISWGKLGNKIGQKGTTDAMGRREGHLFIDEDGKWYLYYGSSANGNSGWRIQLDVSDDKGLTWRKKGDTSIGLSIDAGTGSLQARDMLFMAKFNGVYYMYAMTAYTHSSSVPFPPYFSDVWKYEGNDLENAVWQYSRYQLPKGSTPYTQGGAYMGSVVKDGGNYKMFFSANRTPETYNIGYGTSAAPDGEVTRLPDSLLPEVKDFIIENPKVFYSKFLGKWAMLNNTGYKSQQTTSQNLLLFSDNINSWSYNGGVTTSYLYLLDGEAAVGIHSPIYTKEGQVVETQDGRIPVTFDSLNTADAAASFANHTNRSLFYTIFEPSKYALRRNVTPIYYSDFNPTQSTDQLLTDADSNWSLAFGNNSFKISPLTDYTSSSVVGTGAGRSALIYNHTFAANDQKAVTTNVRCQPQSAGGLVFNFIDSQNYSFVYLFSTEGGIYAVKNGVQSQIVNFDQQADTYGQGIVMSCFGGKWYAEIHRKNQVISKEIEPVVDGSKCGILHEAGTTFHGSFEIAPGFYNAQQKASYIHALNQNISNGVFEFSAFNPKKDSLPIEFKFRCQDNDNYYFVSFAGWNCFLIGKCVAGVKTVIASQQTDLHKVIIGETPVRIRVVMDGSSIKAYCNGWQIQATDTTFESGFFGFNLYYSWNEIRNFRFYKSAKIGIVGTTTGQSVVVRSAGVPVYQGTTASDYTELEISHYPVDEITINGINKKFPNLIYGGDVINFNP